MHRCPEKSVAIQHNENSLPRMQAGFWVMKPSDSRKQRLALSLLYTM